MQIRLLLFLLCVFLMTPIDGYVKAGNGEDTLYYAGRTFSPNSSIGRNNHSLLLKTNAVAWGMAVMNVAVEYDISPAISVLIPFYYSPFNYFTSSRKLRTFCVQPEVRYWFGQVDGLFTGVHIGVASYNYALKNSTYRYQNSDTGTPLLNMGLTAGYRLSLGKGGCWQNNAPWNTEERSSCLTSISWLYSGMEKNVSREVNIQKSVRQKIGQAMGTNEPGQGKSKALVQTR